MLTLLKQARAYGLGVVLATQNPVDLDYKGLSNAGTWFLGRLQTERDKARVLEGLEGASAAAGAGFDRQVMESTLAGLKSRVFLMNNVHDDRPTLFHTRWALSYLRGPLTRDQISRLSGPAPAAAEPAPAVTRSVAVPPPPTSATPPAAASSVQESRPVLPAGVTELFLPCRAELSAGEGLLYRPALLGNAELHYADARRKVDHWETATLIAALAGRPLQGVWKGAAFVEGGLPHLETRGRGEARFADLPAAATRARSYQTWTKRLTSHLYRERVMQLWRSPDLKEVSAPGESEGEFRVRLGQRIREKRDMERSKLERRYAPKLARLQERIRKAQEKVGREKAQYGQQKLQTALSVGATVLGALFGRKAASVGTVGRATTAARGMGRAAREKQDIARALRDLKSYEGQLADLEREFQSEATRVREALDAATLELQPLSVRPRKTDMAPGQATLVWTPWRVRADGLAEPLALPATLREAFD
jgi:hypothetical protein